VTRFAFLCIAVPLAVLLIVFSIVNRQTLSLDLWPLPFEGLSAPIAFLVIGPFLIGILVGAFMAWLQAGESRNLAWSREKQLEAQEKDLESLRRQLAEAMDQKEQRQKQDKEAIQLPSQKHYAQGSPLAIGLDMAQLRAPKKAAK